MTEKRQSREEKTNQKAHNKIKKQIENSSQKTKKANWKLVSKNL